jgi:predicted transcriptional regulator
MASLLEMSKNIVMAHAAASKVSPRDIITEIQEVHATLVEIQKGGLDLTEQTQEEAPAISQRKAFGKNTITCMLCGKQMKTLARHLGTAHDMKPGEYRKQFNIPRTQPLAARSYSESRKQMALDRDLGANLAKARAARGKGKAVAATQKEVPKKAATRKRASKKTESAPEA